jgi:hypothetical protein
MAIPYKNKINLQWILFGIAQHCFEVSKIDTAKKNNLAVRLDFRNVCLITENATQA